MVSWRPKDVQLEDPSRSQLAQQPGMKTRKSEGVCIEYWREKPETAPSLHLDLTTLHKSIPRQEMAHPILPHGVSALFPSDNLLLPGAHHAEENEVRSREPIDKKKSRVS
eukprot:1160862-Pelagomonas_calceolata.AAC.11